METVGHSSPIQNLVENGLLSLPVDLEGAYRGVKFQAKIESDGAIVWNGQSFASPSVAAGYAITKTMGWTTAGRNYLSVNGWLFWQVRSSGGHLRTLSQIRAQLPGSAA